MTRQEAIERLATASEDDPDLASEAGELFVALYGRLPNANDGDAGELLSLCYAEPEVARHTAAWCPHCGRHDGGHDRGYSCEG